MEVVRTERLMPHMVRLVLGGEGYRRLARRDGTDQYIKLLFADPALELPRPYDMDALRERLEPAQLPVTRTYTIRHDDAENEQIWVDFVVHGDEGLAGPWAAAVQPLHVHPCRGRELNFFGGVADLDDLSLIHI